MNTKEAGDELGIGIPRVNQLIKDGRLKAKKDRNGYWVITMAAVDRIRGRKPGYPPGKPRKAVKA